MLIAAAFAGGFVVAVVVMYAYDIAEIITKGIRGG